MLCIDDKLMSEKWKKILHKARDLLEKASIVESAVSICLVAKGMEAGPYLAYHGAATYLLSIAAGQAITNAEQRERSDLPKLRTSIEIQPLDLYLDD